jgi:hypothetical protein
MQRVPTVTGLKAGSVLVAVNLAIKGLKTVLVGAQPRTLREHMTSVGPTNVPNRRLMGAQPEKIWEHVIFLDLKVVPTSAKPEIIRECR